MYTLQGDNFLAQTLESSNTSAYAKRLAHELVHQAVKQDPTLLTALQSMSEYGSSYASSTQNNPVAKFVRFRKIEDIRHNLDSFLHSVTPRFLTKVIHYLRSHGYEAVLAVYPHDAEENALYGGTNDDVYLGLWIHIRNNGYVFIAEGRTKSKAKIAVAIAATGAEHKTRIGEGPHAFDVYVSPVDTSLPNKFRLWE